MLDHLLAALDRQTGGVSFEVLVADRRQDGTAERVRRTHPLVRVITAGAGATLPDLRTLALDHARGRYILVTEDHVVPPPGWVSGLVGALEAAPPRVIGAGGPVDNVMRARAVDWAAFLCEYSAYLPPVSAGEVDDVPGMNIAYRREVLTAIDRADLTRGFWESTVHAHWLALGHKFLRLPEIVMQHRKNFGFFYFLSQRFHYSRYYAGERFGSGGGARRLIYAGGSVLLPPMLLIRIARNAWAKPSYRGPLVRSLPAIGAFVVAWAVGEGIGYLFGPGGSLHAIE
jgi:glycosyl transferase family 2